MLKKRDKLNKKKHTDLNENQLYNLLNGSSIDEYLGRGENDDFPSDEARQKAWKKNKIYIMGLQDNCESAMAKDYRFGLFDRPKAWWNYEQHSKRLRNHKNRSGYESDFDYLKRNNLFTSLEKKVLKKTEKITKKVLKTA